MQAIKFSERILIHCRPAEAFDYTQDYACRLQWDTFLKRAELVEGATRAEKGAKAYCVARNGLGMVTEYVSFRRPRATAIKMTRGPWLFKSFAGSWNFRAHGGLQTEVTFLYAFTLRFPFSLAGGSIRRILQANVRRRLTDLKTNLEQKGTNS